MEKKIYTEEELNALFAELERNIKSEADAREGYYVLMLKYGYLLTPTEHNQIRDIISEELKHTELLNKMLVTRNGILPENS